MFMDHKAEIHGDKIVEGIMYDLSEDCEQAYNQAKFINERIKGGWTAYISGELQKISTQKTANGIETVFIGKDERITKVYPGQKPCPAKVYSNQN